MGRRTVQKIEGERAYIGREGTAIMEIMPVSFIERAQRIDESRLAQQETAQAVVPEPQPEYTAFLEETYPTPLRRGKAAVSLKRSIQFEGQVMPSYAWVKIIIERGGTVRERFGALALCIDPEGRTFYAKPQINGVLLSYAQYLERGGK